MNHVKGTLTVLGTSALCGGLWLLPQSASAQAIPLELTGGPRYATGNLVLSRGFTSASTVGFFHQHTLTVGYGDDEPDDLVMQNLVFFEALTGFRFTAGGFYGGVGFSPTAGMQYVNAGRRFFLFLSPRVNIESEPSFSIFSIFRYTPDLTRTTKFYLGMQLLNTFDADTHVKSYQWLRAGLDINGTQFGVALNLDEFGPNPDLRLMVGIFIRREIS